MKAVKGKLYFGGVHPHDCKDLSKAAALEVMPAPEIIAVSCAQSLGRPAAPIVEVGTEVVEGEVIARAEGPISSDVFASVCGTVTEIKDAVGANGGLEKFIFIKQNGKTDKFRFPPLSSPTADEIKARIKDCGIVGLGGAGFPAAVKVAPRTPVDTLILNGAECEPYLTCDHRLMLEHTDEIARGARLIATTLGVKNIIIGIEANKPDCIKAFEPYEDIKVVILKKQYPMGGEKQLIYVTTGRRVGLGKLPADCGVVVQNVATCFAVCEAVEQGKPLYERIVTVSGKGIKNPKNIWVRVGTSVKDIVDFCGGEIYAKQLEKDKKSIKKDAENKTETADYAERAEKSVVKKVVQGGPMTGVALANLDVYTHKTTSGVLLLSADEAAAEEPTPCLNCGKCADVCPMHLMPMNTAFYSAAGDFDAAAKFGNTASCIECGACEFICPAKRPLIQAIRKTKAYMRSKMTGGAPVPPKPVDQKGRSAPLVPPTVDGKHDEKKDDTKTDEKEKDNG